MNKYSCSVEGCDRTIFKQKLCHAHQVQAENGQPFSEPIVRVPKMTWPADGLCTFGDCNNPYHSKGLCNVHCSQLYKTGKLKPIKVSRLKKDHPWSDRAKFALGQASYTTDNGCVIWTGQTKNGKYGAITFESMQWFVHRLAFCAHQDDPNACGVETVHHKCANSLCINPDHLELATHRENSAEMFERKAYIRTIEIQRIEIENLKNKIQQLEKEK